MFALKKGEIMTKDNLVDLSQYFTADDGSSDRVYKLLLKIRVLHLAVWGFEYSRTVKN